MVNFVQFYVVILLFSLILKYRESIEIVQQIHFEFFAENTTVLAYPELKKVVF